jgi:hypothetical protein
MSDDVDLKDILLDLVVEHGLPAVLQALARIMGSIGSVTGGIVSEVAGVEGWLQQRPP